MNLNQIIAIVSATLIGGCIGRIGVNRFRSPVFICGVILGLVAGYLIGRLIDSMGR